MKPLLVLLASATLTFAADALVPGTLPQSFRSGGPNCLTVPDWQVHAYNEDFYILRESGCINYEKPFLYLIFGNDFALLEDTGAGKVDTATEVLALIEKWAKLKKRTPVPLIVIHSHGHGDHTAGDKGLQAVPGIRFIAATPEAITEATSISKWPETNGQIDLGGRMIDIIPIPGHQAASIALYDRATGNLLTGDSLYPGRLYVGSKEVPTFAASATRLADFVRTHQIAHVLGTHIEQSATPYVDYPTGTVYQPEEHSLALSRAHVIELAEALNSVRDDPKTVVLPDFTVSVRTAAPRPAKP
ncbi:MAG: beta-lactamase domain protein [Bryobacterales bacterium]|nr:beta-lactamase domain protein [Bryobacterales bacterium]